MPDTTKFRDLGRDPRFCPHTATVDTQVTESDAKLWGEVRDVRDPALHDFYAADLTSASAVQVVDGHLDVTVWTPGGPERVVRKH